MIKVYAASAFIIAAVIVTIAAIRFILSAEFINEDKNSKRLDQDSSILGVVFPTESSQSQN